MKRLAWPISESSVLPRPFVNIALLDPMYFIRQGPKEEFARRCSVCVRYSHLHQKNLAEIHFLLAMLSTV